MKRFFSILLAVLMLVSLFTFVSCDKNDEKNDDL